MKNTLTRSIFEVEKYSFLNGSEFCQKLIGTIISVIIIHSASADASSDMPVERFIKLKILLKHSRML